MKCTIFFALALACCLGVALATWGYGGASYVPVYPGAGRSGGAGNGSFFGLIGMLFLLFILFGTNSSSNSDQILLINSTLEG